MYEPEVNDYVIWTTALGMVHEGWVYWKGDPIEPKKGWPTPTDYITIEIATKDREVCEYTADKPIKHKKHHVCLLCYKHQWNELKFVRRRVSKTDNRDPDKLTTEDKKDQEFIDYNDTENLSYGAYKSQRHRYIEL